jgi:penicillin-binding protein 2
MLTALAALETGTISPDTKIEDTGVLTVGKFSFGNWYFSQYGKKEGFLNIVGAIKRSNDIFFYKLGEMIGIQKLADWVKKAGGGSPTGIDMPGEESGLMPDPAWQKEVKGEDWYLGNTYHIAIGQGDILATPLQVNSWTNTVANGGKLCRPHLVRGQKLAAGSQNGLCKDLNLKKENVALVKEGMNQACSPGGTGFPLFNFKVPSTSTDATGKESLKFKIDGVDFLEPTEASVSAKNWVEIPVACKTGTAEYGDPKNKTHAWFTLFAPVVHPQVSITVLVEGGGEGSSVAGPIAKKILDKWFSL